MNSLIKEVIKQEVLQIRVRAVRLCDVLEEDGADDAAAAPHERNLGLVELPAVFLGCVLDEHEALRVRDDLGGVERLLEVVDELGFVAVEGWDGRTLEDLAGAGALGLEGGETSGEDSLANERHGHAEVESVNGSPLASTLLASRVEDLLEEWGSIVVVEVHNIAGDLNEEGVEDALVSHAETALHDVVGLSDQLHVTVLDTVVDHLDVVTGALITDPLAAWLAIALCRDGLQNILDVWPCLLVTTRHNRGTISGTLLTTRDTSANEANALLSQVLGAAVRVWVMGVAAINDDVALLDAALGDERLDELVDGPM